MALFHALHLLELFNIPTLLLPRQIQFFPAALGLVLGAKRMSSLDTC